VAVDRRRRQLRVRVRRGAVASRVVVRIGEGQPILIGGAAALERGLGLGYARVVVRAQAARRLAADALRLGVVGIGIQRLVGELLGLVKTFVLNVLPRRPKLGGAIILRLLGDGGERAEQHRGPGGEDSYRPHTDPSVNSVNSVNSLWWWALL